MAAGREEWTLDPRRLGFWCGGETERRARGWRRRRRRVRVAWPRGWGRKWFSFASFGFFGFVGCGALVSCFGLDVARLVALRVAATGSPGRDWTRHDKSRCASPAGPSVARLCSHSTVSLLSFLQQVVDPFLFLRFQAFIDQIILIQS